MKRINERVVQLSEHKINPKARYVLYRMQVLKRVDNNQVLIFAMLEHLNNNYFLDGRSPN